MKAEVLINQYFTDDKLSISHQDDKSFVVIERRVLVDMLKEYGKPLRDRINSDKEYINELEHTQY